MNDNKYLVLVNKDNPIKDKSTFNMVSYTNSLSEEISVEEKTLDNFLRLKGDMLNIGIDVDLDSGYRSIERQEELIEEFLNNKGEEYTNSYVAKPGYSEHHTGLAIDIMLFKDNKPLDDSETFHNEDIKVIQDNAYKYGFILRYPKDKESITGYNYEPWHFRYIDNIDIAKYIYESNLCLEEYLNK